MTQTPQAPDPFNDQPYRLEQVAFFEIDSPLLQFAKDVASQNGEDGILERIFEIAPPEHRYCVEFGAWDGKYLSNCWNLIANRGWSGCLIEANEKKFADLLKTHGTNDKVACVRKFVGFDGPDSLDNILRSVKAPQDFDLLSIDVDGTDYFIWESLAAHKPRVVIIEFNQSVPNDVIFVQAKNSAINQGCSLLALILLGKEKGYELVCCTRCNAIFVRADLYPKFNLKSNFIGHLYRPAMDGRIFHGYDSYIYVHGMPQLIWSGVPVTNDDFQVVSPMERRFEDAQKG